MIKYLICIFLCTGCAGSLEASRPRTLGASEPTPSARCISLDNKRQTWGAIAKGAAVASGMTSLSALMQDQSREWELGFAAGGLGLAAVSAGAYVVAEGAGEAWVRECSH